MKKAFILFMITVIAGIFLLGCSKSENDSGITSVIYENIEFAENENLESYMATIHEQSPIYAETEKQLKRIFDIYDLKYSIESVEVIEKSDQEAKVRFVQITKKVKGPAFRNNKIMGIHVLKKSNGKWKVYSTKIEKIDYLN